MMKYMIIFLIVLCASISEAQIFTLEQVRLLESDSLRSEAITLRVIWAWETISSILEESFSDYEKDLRVSSRSHAQSILKASIDMKIKMLAGRLKSWPSISSSQVYITWEDIQATEKLLEEKIPSYIEDVYDGDAHRFWEDWRN
ncbi:hypothetical protein GF382_00615 [Candidatus Falkowbacteria bacterium]|nr:hypothetical protein [Candidatus Falkowbacteria bacterium]